MPEFDVTVRLVISDDEYYLSYAHLPAVELSAVELLDRLDPDDRSKLLSAAAAAETPDDQAVINLWDVLGDLALDDDLAGPMRALADALNAVVACGRVARPVARNQAVLTDLLYGERYRVPLDHGREDVELARESDGPYLVRPLLHIDRNLIDLAKALTE